MHFGRNGLVHFSSVLLFSMQKQQENRMVLPLNTSSMHPSAFLMPERPIAEF
jgi:hypothetical protein